MSSILLSIVFLILMGGVLLYVVPISLQTCFIQQHRKFLNSGALANVMVKNHLVVLRGTTWQHHHYSTGLSNVSALKCTHVFTATEHGPTCSCLSSQRSTMGWLALSDERAVSLWNSLWLAHVPASRGRLRYVSIPLPCEDTKNKGVWRILLLYNISHFIDWKIKEMLFSQTRYIKALSCWKCISLITI